MGGGIFPPPSKLPGWFRLTDWLERELQPDLDVTGGSGAHNRVPSDDVRRPERSAESRRRSWVIVSTAGSVGCAVRILKDGVIGDIENLKPELGGKPLFVCEVLEHGEIQVLEARVPEDIPAHRAEGSGRGRCHDRVAIREATSCR